MTVEHTLGGKLKDVWPDQPSTGKDDEVWRQLAQEAFGAGMVVVGRGADGNPPAPGIRAQRASRKADLAHERAHRFGVVLWIGLPAHDLTFGGSCEAGAAHLAAARP